MVHAMLDPLADLRKAALEHVAMMSRLAVAAARPSATASMKMATATSPSQLHSCCSNRPSRSTEHCVTRQTPLGSAGPHLSKTSCWQGIGPKRPSVASRALRSQCCICSSNHSTTSSRGEVGFKMISSFAARLPALGGPPPMRSSSPPAYASTASAASSMSTGPGPSPSGGTPRSSRAPAAPLSSTTKSSPRPSGLGSQWLGSSS
mmetsp:Transcript_16769/g.38817  ORF Transcript_16769/g.38817 Transcript_16769/m.38817 type:complete len:205 (-) Transcript_16769:3671-4285(-)